jgi:hypothetical protein
MAIPAAPPAAADMPVGGGTVTASACSRAHCWTGVLTVDIQPLGRGTALVTWNCQVAGSVDPLLTTAGVCAVGGESAAPVTLPGPFAATAGAAVFGVGSTVDACVGGQSASAENLLGNLVVPAEKCQPLTIVTLPL